MRSTGHEPGFRCDDHVAYPTTQWTLVREAGQPLSDHQRQALNILLWEYWPAIRNHLVSRRRLDPNDADDLLQSFVQRQILNNNLLSVADRTRGRFRSLLARSLDHFLRNEFRRRRAMKRSGERGQSLEATKIEPATCTTHGANQHLDATWARGVVHRALDLMRLECNRQGKTECWELFDARVVAPTLHQIEPVAYAILVDRLGFRDHSHAQNVLATAKRMFVRNLKKVLDQDDPTDLETSFESKLAELLTCSSMTSLAGDVGDDHP